MPTLLLSCSTQHPLHICHLPSPGLGSSCMPRRGPVSPNPRAWAHPTLWQRKIEVQNAPNVAEKETLGWIGLAQLSA